MANALSPYVGSAEAGGAVLGITTVIVAIIGVTIALGKENMKGVLPIAIVVLVTAFVSIPDVGWFPLWVPFVLVVILAFLFWVKGSEMI